MWGEAHKERMTKEKEVQFCPNCGSENIKLVIGGQAGQYECKDCKFRGAIFPEATEEEIKKIREELNKDD